MTLSDEHQFILDYFNEKLPEDYKVKLKNEIESNRNDYEILVEKTTIELENFIKRIDENSKTQ